MENVFQPILEKQKFVLLDGAMATELERMGADLNHPLWSAKVLIENPTWIKQVHLSYLKASADIITTSSYQASFEGFEKIGIKETEAIHIFEKSVTLAEQARREYLSENERCFRPFIAASLGPYGAFLANGSEYTGDYKVAPIKIKDFHRKRLEVLENTSADLLFFETIPSRIEANIIVELLEESGSEKPVLFSFSCQNGEQVSDGSSFSACVNEVGLSKRIHAVGANCTSPKFISSLMLKAQEKTEKPLIAMPNSGENWCTSKKCWEENALSSETFSGFENWLKCGAKLIGGCCRTNPRQIQELSRKK